MLQGADVNSPFCTVTAALSFPVPHLIYKELSRSQTVCVSVQVRALRGELGECTAGPRTNRGGCKEETTVT